MVEVLPQILPVEDAEIAAFARKSFEKQGIKIFTGAKVTRLDRKAEISASRIDCLQGLFDRRFIDLDRLPALIEILLADAPAGQKLLAAFEIGLCKPDPAIFTLLLRRLNLPGARVLFVDDRADNLAAAAAHGIRGHLFTDPPSLRRYLVDAA